MHKIQSALSCFLDVKPFLRRNKQKRKEEHSPQCNQPIFKVRKSMNYTGGHKRKTEKE